MGAHECSIREESPRTWEVHITGYAYETVPNQLIVAGQTSGKDHAAGAPNGTAPNHSSSLRLRAPSASGGIASLGALALGADGIDLWRREDALQSTDVNRTEE